jgi:hypothetical protein
MQNFRALLEENERKIRLATAELDEAKKSGSPEVIKSKQIFVGRLHLENADLHWGGVISPRVGGGKLATKPSRFQSMLEENERKIKLAEAELDEAKKSGSAEDVKSRQIFLGRLYVENADLHWGGVISPRVGEKLATKPSRFQLMLEENERKIRLATAELEEAKKSGSPEDIKSKQRALTHLFLVRADLYSGGIVLRRDSGEKIETKSPRIKSKVEVENERKIEIAKVELEEAKKSGSAEDIKSKQRALTHAYLVSADYYSGGTLFRYLAKSTPPEPCISQSHSSAIISANHTRWSWFPSQIFSVQLFGRNNQRVGKYPRDEGVELQTTSSESKGPLR